MGKMAAKPSGEPSPETCPVDHSAREEWLKAARQLGDSPPYDSGKAAAGRTPLSTSTSRPDPESSTTGRGWISYLAFWRNPKSPSTGQGAAALPSLGDKPQCRERQPFNSLLSTERTVSSIPRMTTTQGLSTCPADHHKSPPPVSGSHANPIPQSSHLHQASPNAETVAPETSSTGNWVYPSESQFFSALQRKGQSANSTDMSIVVPIHNAVNERAWSQILEWETPYPAPCGGPRLHSFSGDSRRLTPKARIMSLLGYQRPFDRHDWTVDRCGTRVDYVIDFYSGKGREGKISFYLDVRPKLNTWEGVKMRAMRMVGLV